MKKFLVNTIWAVGGIALALFCLSACTRELDVQQAYDFSLEVMPVQNSIAKGETAEIRCSLKRSGRFANTRYTIRYFQPDGKGYFQPDGKGCLKMDDGTIFKPNDRYPLTRDTFRLYYTSLSTDRQTIDIYVEDNFGQLQQQTFNFNNEREDKPKSSIEIQPT